MLTLHLGREFPNNFLNLINQQLTLFLLLFYLFFVSVHTLQLSMSLMWQKVLDNQANNI
jgi:hypothetical protein